MAKTYSRTVTVYIDGSKIDNSIPAIQKKVRELTRDVKKMTIGTDEYNKTVKSIAELNSILAEHKKAVRGVAEETETLAEKLGGMADFFNKWYYSIQTGIDALGGVITTIRQCVNDYADMEEAMADVQKYTGQTAAQVRDMNEDFKRMDTRTSREQLNALAGAAGRLGITNKEMIEEFVDGADKINVALGDDLGEGAVDKIGKLAHMFGEDDTKGLRGAMLATGSAVNDLAQSSSANAGYIVDFTADLSGVAIQAGMTQAQIMGLASALDQNMQEEATAFTVFSQLITKMYQEPARFAKIAGEDVNEFTQLLKTNANEALLKFLSVMQSTGGFDKMAPLFSEMKLEGTRAVGVLSSVASHLDQVREAQTTAFNAYNQGTSVLQEFNTQNSTVQAGIDKAKKQFLDLSVELGEKLLPLVKQGISTGSLAVKSLSTITNFVIAHRKALITLTATIAAYVTGVKLSVLWNKRAVAAEKLLATWRAIQDKWLMTIMLRHAVLNGAMTKTVALQKMLNIVIGANPFGAFLAAITAVTTALILYRQKLDDAAIVQNKLNDIKQEAAAKSSEEETHIRTLIDAAKDETLSMVERRRAVTKLNEIIPNYNAQLDATTGKYKASKKALDSYLQSLQRKYELEGAKDELKRIGGEIAKERVKLNKATDDLKKARDRNRKVNNNTAYMPSTWQAGVGIATSTSNEEKAVSDSNEKLRKLYAERKGITDAYGSDLEKDAVGSQSSSTFTNNPASAQSGLGRPSKAQPSHKGTSKPDPEVERQKRVQKELDSITADYESKRTQAKQAYLDGTIATQEDYNRRIEDLELEELNKKLEVAGLEPKKRAEIEKKILDYKVKLYDQLREIEQSFGDTEEERLANELDTIKQKYDQDLALLDNLHDKQLISEEQYQQDLKQLKERYDNDKQKANRESADRVISDAKKTFDELMESQRKANIKNGRIDEQSQTDRLEAWQGYLQKLLDNTSLSAEQRAAIQQQIDDAEVEQTEETLKKKQELAQKYNDIVCETIVSAGQKLGEELGKVLQGEQANFKDFLRGILSLMIDALEKTVLAARAASIAKNVGTLGVAGLAKAAVETALITAAFEMAKAAVGSFDTGGFTPSGAWDKPQGIVHSNEFVANRFATANPAVRPVLNLINEAQRSGSVSRLSADDIAAVVPTTQYQPSTSPHGSARLITRVAAIISPHLRPLTRRAHPHLHRPPLLVAHRRRDLRHGQARHHRGRASCQQNEVQRQQKKKMIKLLIDGSEVRLAADISLEFYDRNPFFTSEGQHTLDIDISLDDPHNARIYRAMHRLDVTARPENRQAVLYCEKGVIIRGTEIILEIDERSAKIQIVSGNSEFNFLAGSDKYLHDLDLGEIDNLTAEEARRSLYSHYPDSEYVCTPVVAKASIRNGIGNMLQSSSTIYNEVDEVAKATTVNLKSGTTLCPQPYLATVIARVLKALGYTRSYDAIAGSPELSRLILVHGYQTTKYSEMLENWTVSDFISEVEHLCGVCLVVDNNAKVVEIQTLANYYSNAAVEEIAHADIIGDINKQYDQDPPDNLVYHNVAYKFPSTSIYKFYALDSDFARRIEYVDCPDRLPQYRNDYASLYNIWYKISGDNTDFYKTDDDAPDSVVASYHSMVAYYDRSFHWSADTPGRRIPLEFPFIVRSIVKKGSNSGVSKCTRLGMVNQFGPRVDETSDDKMELRIVPVENVFCRLHDYYSYPLPVVENGDGDVGNITDEDDGKGVAERLVQGESTERSAKDNMYVGFYMGVSKFECCGEERGDNYPVVPVTINSRLQMRSMPSGTLGYKFWNMQQVKYMDVNGNFDLSINSEHGMYNTHWQIPQQLDLTTVYVIKFRSLQRRDARHIFNIGGRKFYCQQLKYQVVSGRLSDIIEGTFYPLK